MKTERNIEEENNFFGGAGHIYQHFCKIIFENILRATRTVV